MDHELHIFHSSQESNSKSEADYKELGDSAAVGVVSVEYVQEVLDHELQVFIASKRLQ